jgi:hypothetical protein
LAVFSNLEFAHIDLAASIIGAAFVVVSGYVWRRRHHAALDEA